MKESPITLARLLELLPADQVYKVRLFHDGRLYAEACNIHHDCWDSLEVDSCHSIKIQYERNVLTFIIEDF